jgi:hypothetical protein
MNPNDKITPEQMLQMLNGRLSDKDLANLRFLLDLGPERSAEWLMDQDPDDAFYAMDLLKSCTKAIKDQIQELALEEALEEGDDQDLDLTEANLVINRIKGTL